MFGFTTWNMHLHRTLKSFIHYIKITVLTHERLSIKNAPANPYKLKNWYKLIPTKHLELPIKKQKTQTIMAYPSKNTQDLHDKADYFIFYITFTQPCITQTQISYTYLYIEYTNVSVYNTTMLQSMHQYLQTHVSSVSIWDPTMRFHKTNM